jgi:hypothetical protein
MSIILETLDRWDRQIILTEGCWENHILNRRPLLRGHLHAVEQVLRFPGRVTLDANDARRECFYGRDSAIVEIDVILKVVVEFTYDGPAGSGEIVTVIPMSPNRVKSGEQHKWP